MAVKEVSKKRKAPTTEATKPKKQKKVESKTTVVAAPDVGAETVKTLKKAKPVVDKDVSKLKESKKVVAVKKTKPTPAPAPDDEASDEDLSIADRTAALLKGFESSDDDEEDGVALTDPAPIPESELPTIPNSAATALTKRSDNADSDPSVTLYIGRIPHGFYEPQMRAYFAQFGTIAHLRLSRNRRTGASKHYAFVQFASGQVGRIVASTMDNYLLFGHILKVKILSEDQLQKMGPNLWAGEGRRFKAVPWGGLERGLLKSAERGTWEKRVRNEEKRRSQKADKLRELGYEFKAPTMSTVDSVPVREKNEAPLDEVAIKKKQVSNKRNRKAKQIEPPLADENGLEKLIAAQKPSKEAKPVTVKAKKVKNSKGGIEIAEVAEQKAPDGSTVKKSKKRVKETA